MHIMLTNIKISFAYHGPKPWNDLDLETNCSYFSLAILVSQLKLFERLAPAYESQCFFLNIIDVGIPLKVDCEPEYLDI